MRKKTQEIQRKYSEENSMFELEEKAPEFKTDIETVSKGCWLLFLIFATIAVISRIRMYGF